MAFFFCYLLTGVISYLNNLVLQCFEFFLQLSYAIILNKTNTAVPNACFTYTLHQYTNDCHFATTELSQDKKSQILSFTWDCFYHSRQYDVSSPVLTVGIQILCSYGLNIFTAQGFNNLADLDIEKSLHIIQTFTCSVCLGDIWFGFVEFYL